MRKLYDNGPDYFILNCFDLKFLRIKKYDKNYHLDK